MYLIVLTGCIDTVKQTIDKDEEILPNGLYVGVAALAGTILARNRNIVIRFVTSTALAVGTAHYLLPKTTHNVAVQLEKVESKYPELQSAHKSLNDAISDARKQVDGLVGEARGAFDESTSKLFGSFQQNDASQQAKDKFESVKKNVESMYSTRSNVSVIGESRATMTFYLYSYHVAWCRGDFEEEQQLDQPKELPSTYSTPSRRTRLCIEGAIFSFALFKIAINSSYHSITC